MYSLQESGKTFATFEELTKHVDGAINGNSKPSPAYKAEEEMSWEQLTNLYPEVGKVLAYMSENPDLFERDEIAVTVRSLYNLVKLADSTADVLKFLKKYVKNAKQFESFEALTAEINLSAEKHRLKKEKAKQEKKEKKKKKKKKLEGGGVGGGGGAGGGHGSGEEEDSAEDRERELESKKMEEMRKAMAKMGKANGTQGSITQSGKTNPMQQKKNFQVLPQIAQASSPSPTSPNQRSARTHHLP